MNKDLYKPGSNGQEKGEYTEVGARGGKVKDAHHVSVDKGDRMPPTSKKGNVWKKD